MPISDLVFRGITRAVSDINTSDGSTAELINAVVENNELRPAPFALDPRYDFGIPGKLLAIHSLNAGEEVIISEEIADDGVCLCFDRIIQGPTYAEPERINYVSLPREVRGNGRVDILGNVVIYSCEPYTYYILYKAGEYILLGEKPPFPKLSFSLLNAQTLHTEEAETTLTLSGFDLITEENYDWLHSTARAQVNKLLSAARENGGFIFPFFVRYALRMSDGTHILHSAPILINPSTSKIPFTTQLTSIQKEGWSGEGNHGVKMRTSGYYTRLEYRGISNQVEADELACWGDIVTHIDIFVSKPIYSYNDVGFDKGLGDRLYSSLTRPISSNFGVAALRGGIVAAKDLIDIDEALASELILPEYSAAEQYEEIKNTSLFYLIHSLPISDFIKSPEFAWKEVPLEEDVLNSLVNRPVLKDDFNSHVSKYGATSEVYNQRLTIADMSFKPYEGYPMFTMRQSTQGANGSTVGALKTGKIVTVLQKGEQRIVVESDNHDVSKYNFVYTPDRAYGYYYYPDPDAREMYVPTVAGKYQRLQLTEHKGLNGAYCFAGYPAVSMAVDPENATPPSPTTFNTYRELSAVYQSQVGNPFHFPVEGITSIGNTRLIALIASSIEVSTGQVGDYPMYAFCGDGVWVLSISKEGWISSPQLISNDVCLGRSAIVALNRPIIFATDRGLKLLEGSKITSLSDTLLGPRMDISSISEAVKPFDEYNSALASAISSESFIDFLSGRSSDEGSQTPAFFVYDNPNNRVLIMRSDKSYAYVLTLSNFEFSKMVLPMSVSHSISHFSGVYLQSATPDAADYNKRRLGKLKGDIDADGDIDNTAVIVITRPIKLGDMSLKSIKRMLTRHNCESGVKTLLYGSRDGINYCSLTSLRGRPYRYYILALFASMTQQERISTVSIDWERRLTNKLR